MTDAVVELPEADVRELLAAAKELHGEASCAWTPEGLQFNALEESTERRFVLALDAVKDAMGR